MRRFGVGLVTASLLCSSSVALTAQSLGLESRRAQFREAIAAEWQYELRTHPELATYVGDARYNDRLSDLSAEAVASELKENQKQLALFSGIDSTGFSPEELLNKELMIRSLRQSIEQAQLKGWEMPVDQMNGIHLELAQLPSQMPFNTIKDYENYIARLHAIPRVLEQTTVVMRQGLRDRLMPPKYLLDKVGEQAQGIADDTPEHSPFVRPVAKFAAGIAPADQERLRKEVAAVVEKEVNPAYAALAKFVKEEYALHGREEYGLWALPNGDAMYRAAVKAETTTNLSPAEIHAMGLRQVAEIEAEMLKLANSQGYKDMKSFNAHIRDDRKMYGTSGQQIFDLYKHYAEQMEQKLPEYFGKQPPTRLEVVAMDSFRAPDAVPADYSPGTGDGSRPGRINVNEYGPDKRLLLNVEAIAYHEGIPGHHLQFSIAKSLPDLPEFRRNASYNAYSEGWAFYSERLAREMGFYQDPYSEYGRLENEMWRSVRLVVDTGVHYKHWSRQQMIDFFTEHTAMDAQNIATEVDRYIAWPGQALGYKLGQMTILKLREDAKRQLGDRFDIRKFHDAVLEEGPLPLDVLEEHVHKWLAQQKTVASVQ
ncbi:MAG TPA: DUF885 domain-containing protein [Terracidiphilus sp.]|jgi:uncharacterized protein (DUF885 family)